MEDFNLRELDREVVAKCAEYITLSKDYSLEIVMTSYELLKDAKPQGENWLITCPFHEDWSPSMSVNFRRDMYRCFSCGNEGGMFKFIVQYSNIVLGRKTNYYAVLEEMLKKDTAMQAFVKAKTIYKDSSLITLETFKMDVFSSDNISEFPSNYIELANMLKRDRKITINNKITMIALMQKQVSPEEIYRDIYNLDATAKLSEGDYDFAKYFN